MQTDTDEMSVMKISHWGTDHREDEKW